jgi:autotransporter-associated beta strand protein
MTAANWNGGTQAPSPGDDLVFPFGAGQLANTNDFADGTAFNSITFTGTGYNLTGGQILLNAGGLADNVAGANSLGLNLALPATRSFTVIAGGTLSVGGSISGSGGLTKSGTGTLIVSGNNSYGGVTTISQGVLNVRSATALGLSDGTLSTGSVVANGAALEVQGGLSIGNEALTLNGSGILTAGALRGVSGVNSWAGPITLASDATVAVVSGQLTLSGVVSGTGGLTVTGAGEARLTAANTFSGSTVVSNGGSLTFRGQFGSALNSPSFTVQGSTLTLDNFGDGGRSDFNNNNRIRDNAVISLNGGNLNFFGNDIDNSNEVVGAINLLGGFSHIRSVNGGGTLVATLTSSRLNRSPGATVWFEGPQIGSFVNKILFTTVPALSGGVLPYATCFDTFFGFFDFATADSTFGIFPNVHLPADINQFSVGANVVVTQQFISVPDPGVTINSLYVIGTGITVSGAPLTVASGGVLVVDNVGAQINMPTLNFGSAEGIVLVPGLPDLPFDSLATIDSSITGSGGLTKTGFSTLQLSNISPTAGNSYVGTTTLNAGTLVLNKTNGLTAIPGPLVIGDDVSPANSHIVRLSQPNQIAPSAPVTVTSSGLLDLNGNNDTIGPLTITNGNVTIGIGALTVAGLTTLTGGNITTSASGLLVLGGDVTVTASLTTTVIGANLSLGTVAVGGATRTFNVASGVAAVGLDIRSPVGGADAGVSLVKSGLGTLRFSSSSSNTYAGGTTVTQGTLLLDMQSGAIAISGPLIVGAAVGAANSAVVRLMSSGQIASAVAVAVANSGLFDLNNNNNTIASLTMAGGNVTTGTGTLTVTGNISGNPSPSAATIAGNLVMGTGNFTLASGASMTVSAVLNGASGLTKNGPGLLQLAANNLYPGLTTVNGGTLVLTSSQTGSVFTVNTGGTLVANSSQPNSTITVNNGGMLRGTGTVGNLFVAVGGSVLPGSPPASTGILNSAGNVFLSGTYIVSLNGTVAGTGYNQLAITSGTLDLTGSTLSASLGFVTSTNDTFIILRKPAAGAITGNFAGLPEGAGLAIGNRLFRISYVGGSGNDVVLTTLTSATAIAVVSGPNNTFVGQPVTFTATVSAVSGVGTPTGTVTFTDGATILGTVSLSGGQASFTTSTLSPGTHSVNASYSGDSIYNPSSSSSPAIQTVISFPTTATALASSINIPSLGQSITFTATVSVLSGSGTPTGTVTFFDGTAPLGSSPLSGGTATFSTSMLTLGRHSMTAVYNGDRVFVGSTSPALIQIVGVPNEIFIDQLYRDLLQRPAENAAVTGWTGLIAQGHSRAEIAQAILDSPERHNIDVKLLYRQYLHRDADPLGLEFWAGFLNSGGTLPALRVALVSSTEYYLNLSRSEPSLFLQALYEDALGREPDVPGRQGFLAALSGGATRAQVAQAIFSSTEFRQDLVQGYYLLYLHRPADSFGLNGFVGALGAGLREQNVLAAIVGSDEYFGRV